MQPLVRGAAKILHFEFQYLHPPPPPIVILNELSLRESSFNMARGDEDI